MSTRSRIGMVTDDGKVVSIYCHHDGYPSYVGEMLLENYTDKAKVERLISLGDISILDAEVEPKETGRFRYAELYPDKPEMVKHTFDTPQEGVVLAYGRDRGEDPETVKPRVDESVEAYEKSDLEEWGYLFKDGKWFVTRGYGNRELVPLTKEYIAESE